MILFAGGASFIGSNFVLDWLAQSHAAAVEGDARYRFGAGPYRRLITRVTDRPGHDRRCAIDVRKSEGELGWRPAHTFETGLCKTLRWYLGRAEWTTRVQTGAYRNWLSAEYGTRDRPEIE